MPTTDKMIISELMHEVAKLRSQLSSQEYQLNGSTNKPDADKRLDPFRELQIMQSIIEQSPIGYMQLQFEDVEDVRTIRVHNANKAALQALGLNKEDIIGKYLHVAFDQLLEQLPELVAAYRDQVVKAGKTVDLGEVRYGDERVKSSLFHVVGHSLYDGHFFITYENTTEKRKALNEQKRLNDKLKKSKVQVDKLAQTLSLAIESSGTGVWNWDLETGILHFDKRMHEIFCISRKVTKFEHFRATIHTEDVERVEKAIQVCIDENQKYDIEYRISIPDGSTRHIAAAGTVRYSKTGKPVSFTGTCLDITERVQNKEALVNMNAHLEELVQERTAKLENEIEVRTQINKDLESFSYTVSHDLRAPLRALQGFSKQLSEKYGDNLDAQGKRWVRFIHSNADRMDKLITDMLDYTRINRAELISEEVDTTQIIHRKFNLLKNGYSHRITLHVQEDLPPMIGDQTLLRMVWMNLIDNAFKYTSHKAEAVIEISGERNNDQLIYRIKDNGAGFDMRHSDNLFGMFKRLHGSDEFPGTGVGLASVKRIIDRHNGTISAIASVDKGAEFEFRIPTKTNL